MGQYQGLTDDFEDEDFVAGGVGFEVDAEAEAQHRAELDAEARKEVEAEKEEVEKAYEPMESVFQVDVDDEDPAQDENAEWQGWNGGEQWEANYEPQPGYPFDNGNNWYWNQKAQVA